MMGARGARGMCWPRGHAGTPRRASAELGTGAWDGKTREAAGAARARERHSRWERPYGVEREGCYQQS